MPLRLGKRSSGSSNHDNIVGKEPLKMHQLGLRMGIRNLKNMKKSLNGPLGWESWKQTNTVIKTNQLTY